MTGTIGIEWLHGRPHHGAQEWLAAGGARRVRQLWAGRVRAYR